MVVTLALGIGANTAIFTVLNAALWRPLPYTDPGSLVVLREYQRADSAGDRGVSYLNFLDWRDRLHTVSSMAIVAASHAPLKVGDSVVRAEGAYVSSGFFRTLGVPAALGTTLDSVDERGLTDRGLPALMLSDAGWRKYFQRDPGIVGREVELDGRRHQIVGVTSAGIVPLSEEPFDFWASPMTFGASTDPKSANGSRNFRMYPAVLARMNPGTTIDAVQRELDAVNEQLAVLYPKAMAKRGASVEPLRAVLVGDTARPLWLLFGMVSAVLLIACVNVANLGLARGASRHREVAIRTALGASRIDIVRQFVTESVLVSLAGGIVGLGVSVWIVAGLAYLLPAEVPKVAGVTPDLRVFLFALSAALVTGVICGIVPALAVTRHRVSGASLADGRRPATGSMPRRLRDALITVEVAAALALLCAAGLMTNSLLRLGRVSPGFDAHGIVTTRVSLDGIQYESGSTRPRRINATLDDLAQRLRTLPGVSDVAFAQSVPLTGVENSTQFSIVGRPKPEGKAPTAGLRFVSADYFQTLRIPVQNGRAFSAQDVMTSTPVVAVNAEFVRQFLPGDVVIGRTLELGWGGDAPKQIVAVVGDVRHRNLADRARPEMYVPQSQFGNTEITALVRTTASAEQIGPAMLAAVHAADPALALTPVRSLDDYRADTLALPRCGAWLIGGFGALALVLTAVGLYGVTSYTTAQRTQEIGVRVALGAQVTDVLSLVVGQGLRPVVVGLALGATAFVLGARVMQAWLYDVTTSDPVTLVVVSTGLAIVALLACYLPARLAARVDPLTAMRH